MTLKEYVSSSTPSASTSSASLKPVTWRVKVVLDTRFFWSKREAALGPPGYEGNEAAAGGAADWLACCCDTPSRSSAARMPGLLRCVVDDSTASKSSCMLPLLSPLRRPPRRPSVAVASHWPRSDTIFFIEGRADVDRRIASFACTRAFDSATPADGRRTTGCPAIRPAAALAANTRSSFASCHRFLIIRHTCVDCMLPANATHGSNVTSTRNSSSNRLSLYATSNSTFWYDTMRRPSGSASNAVLSTM
mmetsp:Transcript_8248/g.26342  ORF Transcript_8248/g.26342 Transcript_8248/m.26342 type:complete len:249 (-) Transcript_8248:885-1631(-)